MLDAHQLNVFLAAAETLNFTQAASRLHMSQPSVSQHIQTLEQHFETPLFIRSGRRIELTDAGIALVPLARELVSRSIHIEETMRSLEGEVHGHLLVGCSTTPGKYILPHLLARFHRLHPKVKVSCHVASQTRAIQMVGEGDVNFALISSPQLASRDMELRRFMVDPVVLIAPLSHPWAQREEIEPDELYNATFILREENSGTQTTVNDGLAAIGINTSLLETLLVLGNSEAIALAVKEGLGLGFVSNIVVERLVKDQVATIPIRGVKFEREIYIGRHLRRPATMAQKSFWEFVKHEIESESIVVEEDLDLEPFAA
ncbi:MAG: LysR family transcriptional regulator [Anaerolineales bacterium]|nr:LysR family transcriptional regulator [Anaerolineales bacterium]MCA9927033.1 LysR family transcriptional regulator [Anaerolineales bacterium]